GSGRRRAARSSTSVAPHDSAGLAVAFRIRLAACRFLAVNDHEVVTPQLKLPLAADCVVSAKAHAAQFLTHAPYGAEVKVILCLPIPRHFDNVNGHCSDLSLDKRYSVSHRPE